MSMRLCTVPLLVCLGLAASLASAAEGVKVRVELDDGTAHEGRLVEVGVANLQVADAGGGVRPIPLERVRAVGRIDAPAAARGRVGLTLTDGTTLTGDEFSWSGDVAVLEGSMGRIELPLLRVRAVAWRAEGEAAAKSWLEAVPEGATSDLVVIGKPEGFEFVECAISAIGPDTVTVVLDDETIPVKRSKVAGLRWLRSDAAAPIGRTVVDIVGGRLRADSVAWTTDGLLLDAAADRRMRVPAEALVRIDYAAGRTTLLADVAPEKLDVEPFFGTLVRIEELAAVFSPRPVAADVRHAKPGLAVRPRTVAVWRIPTGARRFRTALSHGAGAGPALVMITVDDRRAFEQVIGNDGESVPVVLDVTGARRLGVTVDFGPAGAMAGTVRFEEPAIEQ